MSLDTALSLLRFANRVTVLTGAGVSVESGIPTYRDEDGLWNKYRAEDFSSLQAFEKDPEMVWEWYHARRKTMREAKPNAAHLALATLEKQVDQFTLITQNVDGLHQRAGSKNVLEMHGSVWRFYCSNCDETWDDVEDSQTPWEAIYKAYDIEPTKVMPCCAVCKTTARPAVVWFGESLDRQLWDKAFAAATQCDVLIVVGTSAMVDPVASLIPAAKERGTRIIEINTGTTEVSGIVDCLLLGTATEMVPALIDKMKGKPQITGNADTTIMMDQDLSAAFDRGIRKFLEKHPELKKEKGDQTHEGQA